MEPSAGMKLTDQLILQQGSPEQKSFRKYKKENCQAEVQRNRIRTPFEILH